MAGPDLAKLREIETAEKTFLDLKKEIVDAGKCTYCNACVEFCGRENFDAISLEGDVFQFVEERCTGCGVCYAICPEVKDIFRQVSKEARADESPIGHVEWIGTAVTRDRDIRARCLDGGVVSSLLCYLLETGKVDGVAVAEPSEPYAFEPTIATTRAEVLSSAGFRFNRAGSLAVGGEAVANFQILSFLRRYHRQHPDDRRRIAVVGTPCQVYTVRRMQMAHVAPFDRVAFTIGLLCYGNFSLEGWRRSRFEAVTDVPLQRVERMNMKADLTIYERGGSVIRRDLDELSSLFDQNCLSCVDYSSRFSDVSVGGLGSPDGFNTVVVRTPAGKEATQGAMKSGYLMEWGSLFHKGSAPEPAEALRAVVTEKSDRKAALVARRGRTKAEA